MARLCDIIVILCVVSYGYAQDGYLNTNYNSRKRQPIDNLDYSEDYSSNSNAWNQKPVYNSNSNSWYQKPVNNMDFEDTYDNSHSKYQDCYTPNGEKAKCIPLDNCPILKQYSSHDPNIDKFFKESKCGNTHSKLLVCCGTVNTYKQNQKPSTNLPPTTHFYNPPSYLPSTPSTINNPTNVPVNQDPNLGTAPQNNVSIDIRFGQPTLNPKANVKNHPNFNLLPSRNTCGLQGFQDKIVGGSEAELGEFPWMALVGYQYNSISTGYKCGGMLINDKYVLTAAHCVSGNSLPRGEYLTTVRLGEHDVTTTRDCKTSEHGLECNLPPQDIGIEYIIIHPEYNTTNWLNDIALLRLRQIPTQNDFVRPICLSTEGEKAIPGQNLTIAGWGITSSGVSRTKLQKASVPYVDDNECKTVWKNEPKISDHQFCAGGVDGIGACGGDSGGPIIALSPGTPNWYAEGIVSFGSVPCGKYPVVFVRLSSYIIWILDNIKP